MEQISTPQPRRSVAAETSRLYASDWRSFATWCRGTGAVALPGTPELVAAYLQHCAGRVSAGALARRAAAIGHQHRQARHDSPTAHPLVRAILRQARAGAAPRRAPQAAPAALIRMAAGCPGDLAGIRDRALLLLLASGLGRTAVTGLEAEQARFTAAGVVLRLGAGDRLIEVSAADRGAPCPVRALEAWLRASGTQFGPIFRKIDRWGSLEYRRLGADAVRRVLLRRRGAG